MERATCKHLPIGVLAFTTNKGLVVDFDFYDLDNVERIARWITDSFDMGDFLVVKSSWYGQLTLEGKPAIDAHVIFGKPAGFEKVRFILYLLWRKRIINSLTFRFYEWEKNLTIRVGPKIIGQPVPVPIKYVKIDGQDEIIQTYLRQRTMTLKALSEILRRRCKNVPCQNHSNSRYYKA